MNEWWNDGMNEWLDEGRIEARKKYKEKSKKNDE